MQRRSLTLGIALAVIAAGAGFATGIWKRNSNNFVEVDTNNANNDDNDRKQIAHLLSLSLDDARRTPVALSRWQGKTLVINYWATWCPPCRDDMPGFSRLASEFADKGVQFIGIAIDSEDNVRDFIDKTPAAYPLLIATPAAIAVAKNLGNSGGALPFTVVINPDGSVRDKHLGGFKEAALGKVLQR